VAVGYRRVLALHAPSSAIFKSCDNLPPGFSRSGIIFNRSGHLTMPRIPARPCVMGLCCLAASFPSSSSEVPGVHQVPAGTILEIRLTRSLASFSSKQGAQVEGVVIAPVREAKDTLVPMGTKVLGNLHSVRRVGVGLIHETAELQIDFNTLTLPGGAQAAISARVTEVDNARESVDANGAVRGIRSTGTLGFRANNFIAGIAIFDPIAYLYVNIAAARLLRFSEPEIWFPAGTELEAKLTAPFSAPAVFESAPPPITGQPGARSELESLIRSLPYRTATKSSNKPSDITNLLFLGDIQSLKRAFRAAGWVPSDELNANTGFLTLRSIAEDQGYQSAPMSTLLLDELPPDLTLSKTLNTFSKRHHTRIWLLPETWKGMNVLTASSTQDIGISISRKNKTFIHVIDTFIDNERAKIVNDLVFTGCVDAAELIPRPWVPIDARNATGEPLITDRQIAVLQLNRCANPKDPVNLEAPADIPRTGPAGERGVRQAVLTIRNDVYRGNLVYQGYEGVRLGVRYLKRKGESEPEVFRTSVISGDTTGNEGAAASSATNLEPGSKRPNRREIAKEQSAEPLPNPEGWAPSRFEIGLQGGGLRYGSDTLDQTRILLTPLMPNLPLIDVTVQNRLYNGWAAGTSLTLNTYRYFSSEFAFTYQHGKYRLGGSAFTGVPGNYRSEYQEQTTGLLTRQFQYNLLLNLRPREKRLRPYVAAGPVLQLINLTEAPFKSSAGVFKVGLRNVGILLAAYNFGSTPPLDGGGIFQFAFQYGGGLKYRVTPRWSIRLDYRETLGQSPNFIGRSIFVGPASDSDPYKVEIDRLHASGALRQQRATLGVSFGF
jgi:opacity protein-like surface antigen